MFGYLRFILAIFVILSHLDIRCYGLNQGVISVVIFYILSGFVVSNLYRNIISIEVKNKKHYSSFFTLCFLLFIKNRIRRIFPLYFFILFLTISFLLITNFTNLNFTPFNIFTNLTIIPLNFYMWLDSSILTDQKYILIPPAWSLGTELQAYLLLPFALIFPKIKYLAILVSFSIYMLANFNIIHTDYYGYRLIVGVFFIFMLGSSLEKISKNQQNKFDKSFLISIWAITFISIFGYNTIEIKVYARETTIGILTGIPLIYFISKIKKKLILNSFLGKLSYSLFLSHFLAIWLVEYLFSIENKIIKIVIITFIIALIGVYTECIYLARIRRFKKRENNSL